MLNIYSLILCINIFAHAALINDIYFWVDLLIWRTSVNLSNLTLTYEVFMIAYGLSFADKCGVNDCGFRSFLESNKQDKKGSECRAQ